MAQISFFKRSIGMLPKGVRRKVYRIQAVESADQQHALQLRDGSDAITHQDTIVLMISHNFFFFQINAVQPAYSAAHPQGSPGIFINGRDTVAQQPKARCLRRQLPLHSHVHIANNQAFGGSTYQHLMLLGFINDRNKFPFNLSVQINALESIHLRDIEVHSFCRSYP